MTRTKHLGTKRLLAGCACLLLCVGAGLAQENESESSGEQRPRPNLTGTWALAETTQGSVKSKHPAQGAGQVKLVILDRQPEVRITRTRTSERGEQQTQEFIFYADGRGETNQGPAFGFGRNDLNKKVKSSTVWKKNRLRTESAVQIILRGNFHTVDIIDEWELSVDGQTLTQHTFVNESVFNAGAPAGVARGRGPDIPGLILPGGGRIKRVYRRLPA